ncbi:hypothetical protein K7A41_06355 [Sphingobacterium sp. InxBP1]|uniref:hypothetical protein n=1 Tax=Sphingobacterium sp. InxBP1 TaxID=2870328 RepID=UPI0022432C41|nr:hypothetical protein [Sphingobacterium sp. InxBP1]MCW8310838.1 hypothetical protein [Sphingobacterium sp. InxBP1]
MTKFKLSFYLIGAALIFATEVPPSLTTAPVQDRSNANYLHLEALDHTIQDGLSTRLFFPASPKEQLANQLK